MESWSYVSEESVSPTNAIARAKNGSLNWGFKTPEINNNQGFAGFGFPRKSVSNACNSASMCMVRDGVLFNPITTDQNAFSEEEDSSSKLSTSVVESNSRDSGLIDLKLGRFGGDQRDVNPKPKPKPNLGSAESSAKRMRVGGLGSQTPLCQVHGCKKNLSSSKDYHKRHKVCEAHSKTSKVIVNSLEQRFCQQCSRFHLLAEFDEDKRSCRKRLAGHNERRRKPHVGVNSRPGRLFSLYNCTTEGTAGSRSKGTMSAPLSYTSQDMTPNSIPYPHKYGTNVGGGRIKLEDDTCHDPQSTISFTDEKLRSQCLHPFGSEKYYPLHESATNSCIRSKSDGGRTQYSNNTGLSNFGSRPVFLTNSIGGEEDFTMFGSASTVQGLSGIPSGAERALSLLSSQLQNSSSLSSRFHMAHPLLVPGSQDARYSGTQFSENLLEMGPQASGTGVSKNCHSSGISSVEETHLDPILISDGNNAATFGIDGLFRGSEYKNSKDQFCSPDGSTIDLLQLSSQLQRVEHQRQGLHVKPEDDAFFGLRIS